MFALASTSLDNSLSKRYMDVAAKLTNTCHESYARSETKLGPEAFRLVLTKLYNNMSRLSRDRVTKRISSFAFAQERDTNIDAIEKKRENVGSSVSHSLMLIVLRSSKYVWMYDLFINCPGRIQSLSVPTSWDTRE